jgi:NAD+ synthase
MGEMQQRIIRELEVLPNIDPTEEIERRSQFLASHLGERGLKGFVLGISGGQDSLLAGLLAKRAVGLRREAGHDADFHAMLLPYGQQADREDALLACEFIQPDYTHDLDIKPATDAFAESFELSEDQAISDFSKGNVKARMRMIAQYALAGEYRLLVIGTDHAAEAVTGFFTKYGDGGADILPLSGLTKRQGRAMLETLGAPAVFTTKAPTADLLDNIPGQTDEAELGLSYTAIDDYLEGKVIPSELAEAIEKRYEKTAHKRALPVSPSF